MWSFDCRQFAELCIGKPEDNFWNFPYDWVEHKLKDIDLVFDAMKLIEKENLADKEKDKIKARFLLNKYFNEHHLEIIQKQAFENHCKNNKSETQQTEEKVKIKKTT